MVHGCHDDDDDGDDECHDDDDCHDDGGINLLLVAEAKMTVEI